MKETETSWLKYSEYILITIERLVDAVSKNEKEVSLFREKLVRDLTALKEGIRKDILDSQAGGEEDLDKALSKIDKLILDLSTRTIALEKVSPEALINQKLVKFREKYILPVQVRVAVLSTLLGALGGALVYIIPKLLLRWFSG